LISKLYDLSVNNENVDFQSMKKDERLDKAYKYSSLSQLFETRIVMKTKTLYKKGKYVDFVP